MWHTPCFFLLSLGCSCSLANLLLLLLLLDKDSKSVSRVLKLGFIQLDGLNKKGGVFVGAKSHQPWRSIKIVVAINYLPTLFLSSLLCSYHFIFYQNPFFSIIFHLVLVLAKEEDFSHCWFFLLWVTQLSNDISTFPIDATSLCVCVCVWEREREREELMTRQIPLNKAPNKGEKKEQAALPQEVSPKIEVLHLMFYYEFNLYWMKVCWLYERFFFFKSHLY